MQTIRLLIALVAGAVALSVAWTEPQARTASGRLRGRVIVPDVPASVRRPAPADLTVHPRDAVDRRRCVVYLSPGPREAFGELRAGRARMDQRAEQFMPRILAITAGTSVEFPNNDKTFHNVFSLARARTFDLGRYPPGKTGNPVRFDRTGIVPVFCDIHSHMSAYILVFNHPFFAVTDEAGRYKIPDVPAGTYTLMVWSEVGRVVPRQITVGEGGTVEADFQVDREPS